MARLQNQCINVTIESKGGGLPLIMIKGTFCTSKYFPWTRTILLCLTLEEEVEFFKSKAVSFKVHIKSKLLFCCFSPYPCRILERQELS